MDKTLFRFRKVESPLSSFCKAEDETYIHLFCRCRKTSILWRQLQEFFSIALDLPNTLTQGANLGFLDDALEHNFLINHILLIFKNYLYKARENKYLNFNMFFVILLLFSTVRSSISNSPFPVSKILQLRQNNALK